MDVSSQECAYVGVSKNHFALLTLSPQPYSQCAPSNDHMYNAEIVHVKKAFKYSIIFMCTKNY